MKLARENQTGHHGKNCLTGNGERDESPVGWFFQGGWCGETLPIRLIHTILLNGNEFCSVL
jgi:hypothetical protein